MALIVLASAKGSPGVTTSALALTLASMRPVLLVEADPAGGDAMAGYLRGRLGVSGGLADLAVAARHDGVGERFRQHLVDLRLPGDGVERVLLAGIDDPAQAAVVAGVWPALAAHLAGLACDPSGIDVIVDAGRLWAEHAPDAVLRAADQVLLVVRGTLRAAVAARAGLESLARTLGPQRRERVGLLVVEGEDYPPRELGRWLGCPVRASLPWSPRDAAAVSEGIGRVDDRLALIRAARTARDALQTLLACPPAPAAAMGGEAPA